MPAPLPAPAMPIRVGGGEPLFLSYSSNARLYEATNLISSLSRADMLA